jgi:hypothetical protein
MDLTNEDDMSRSAGGLMYRQLIWTRVAHWAGVITLSFLLFSGLQIFNAHSSLHVGQQTGIGIDLERFRGQNGWFLAIPATLVVGEDGRVRARFVDPDFRHRMSIVEICA